LSRSVLVVDDNKNQVESIAMLLRILGCEVRAAHDGLSALELLKEFNPEFALIDIGLPGIDGFELARRIRKINKFKNIVLIAQTGWGREEDRAESRQAGFDYHLVKPLDFQLLERILTAAEPMT
jgi:CheY-like chemotaxis protein